MVDCLVIVLPFGAVFDIVDGDVHGVLFDYGDVSTGDVTPLTPR